MFKSILEKVVENINLSEDQASEMMEDIMTGKATNAQIASFITAMRMKGETIDEITGCVRVMRKHATQIKPLSIDSEVIVDTCGTGGDKSNTFNISTVAAFITAAAGVKVAKHGNRAVSSKSGSADVLLELGVNLELEPKKVGLSIDEIGIGFLFAPLLHKAMKYAIGPRRELGIRTIFNILGPLTNPAGSQAQVVGVFDASLTPILAEVLNNLGTKQAFVVHGKEGLDEISISGETQISELSNNKVRTYTVTPEDFGITPVDISKISGGDTKENARIIKDILDGKKSPHRDIACLNAAAAIVAGGRASDIKSAVKVAYDCVDSGKAKEKLEKLISFSNS